MMQGKTMRFAHDAMEIERTRYFARAELHQGVSK